VTGHGDLPLVDIATPPLTTVRIDDEEMGRLAGRLALRVIKAGSSPGTMEIESTLVVRASTARPRGGAETIHAGDMIHAEDMRARPSPFRRLLGRPSEQV